MKTQLLAAVAVVALTAAFVSGQARDPKADAALQAAIKLETIDGNLKGAIEAFSKILSTYASNRPVAAQALSRMAECYEKLGTTQLDEARKAYERLVRDFGDQRDLVTQAQVRLAAIGGVVSNSALVVTTVWSPQLWGRVSVSADGRWLEAMVDSLVSDGDLTVRDVATGRDQKLPGSESWGESVISPDGRQIVGVWEEQGKARELRVIQVGDGSTRTLWRTSGDDYAEPADWSPDGSKVLARIRRVRSDLVDLAVISIVDRSVKLLKTAAAIGAAGVPRFSPDGRFIVHTADRTGPDGKPLPQISRRATLHIMPAVGGADVALVPSAPAEVDWDPIWTPDGQHIVFASSRSGEPAFWSVAVVNGQPQGEPVRLDAGVNPKEDSLIGFAADGTLFSHKVQRLTGDIFIVEIDPATAEVVTPAKRLNQANLGAITGPMAWSRDGEWIAFNRNLDSRRTLILHSMATGEDRELTEANPWVVDWFPDDQSLLTGKGEMRTDVKTGYTQAVPGLAGANLVPNVYDGTGAEGDGGKPALSPDGKTLFYRARDSKPSADFPDQFRLVRRDVGGGQERVIYQSTTLAPLAISPDSSQVAFVEPRLEPDYGSVMVVPAQGGQAREVFRGWAWGMGWSRDGKYLLLRGANDGLLSVPLAGGAPKPTGLRFGLMAVNPDGRRVAYLAAPWDGLPIVAIRNALAGLGAKR